MVGSQDTSAELFDFIERIRELLDQSWLYHTSFPHSDQRRVTECLELLHLLAEFTANVQRMALVCSTLVVEAHGLGLSDDDVRRLIGIDLGKLALALAHTALATDLSTAGNRAIDILGETNAHA